MELETTRRRRRAPARRSEGYAELHREQSRQWRESLRRAKEEVASEVRWPARTADAALFRELHRALQSARREGELLGRLAAVSSGAAWAGAAGAAELQPSPLVEALLALECPAGALARMLWASEEVSLALFESPFRLGAANAGTARRFGLSAEHRLEMRRGPIDFSWALCPGHGPDDRGIADAVIEGLLPPVIGGENFLVSLPEGPRRAVIEAHLVRLGGRPYFLAVMSEFHPLSEERLRQISELRARSFPLIRSALERARAAQAAGHHAAAAAACLSAASVIEQHKLRA